MVFAAPTDKRPQLLPVREIGEGYDAAVDGLPLILDWTGEGGFYNSLGSQDAAGYEAQSEEIGISQTSTSDKITENKLGENEFWRSMRNFQGGLAQKRLDVPDVSDDSAYWESRGVDPRRTDGLVLARKTTVSAPGTFSVDRFAADAASNGFWFISQNSSTQEAVTHYDFSTFTTKTRTTTSDPFFSLAVAPDDTCYIASNEGVLKVTTATSISVHCADVPAYKIVIAKHRIFIIGFNGAVTTNYAIYEIPLEGTITATLKLNPGPGLIGADIVEAGALVLFAFNPFPSAASDPVGPGIVYGYDGTNAPTRMLTLPKGEEILWMHPILGGAQVLLGVRRMDANQNVRGLLYLVDVNGVQLSNARIVFEYPEQYTKFQTGRDTTVSLGRYVLFPGALDPNHPGGVGIDAYDIAHGTVSHLLLPPTVETAVEPIWVTQHKGRVAFGQIQSSVYKVISESNTDYLADGVIDTSIIDLNVDAPKLWSKVEAACLPLAAGQKIELYWTADDPASSAATWTLLAALHPGMSSLIVPLGVQSAKLALRAKLYAPGSPTSTPTLTKLGVGALMARPPALVHHLKVLAFADMEILGGQQFVQAAEDYWWRLSEQLEGMRVTGRPVWLQTPPSRFDGHVHRVRVGQMVRRMLNHPSKGQGGLIAVKLANVEPDRRNLLPLPVASFGAVPTALVAGDVFETVGAGTTLAKETALQPWTPGATSFVKVTPNSTNDGVRGPAPHQQVPWDAPLRKGQPLSASAMVRPYADGMSFQLIVEAWDAANNLEGTYTSGTFAFGTGSAGQWLPIYVEDFNTDLETELLFLTVQVLFTAGTIAAFGIDALQLEQAFIATPWVPPPTNV
jgi:hypothetical protein